ncbi:MAG: nitrite reductase, copper-containing, partial [Candidatus Pacebacteria bacterium]|nr:nitrite reductase, copper-containing [Candidatus Paceibacterota bacterium]
FHVIGEIFDRVYREGDLVSAPAESVQTTLIPAGGAAAVEFTVDYPGKYILVDHALSRLDRGAWGVLDVTGEADTTIFNGEIQSGHGH